MKNIIFCFTGTGNSLRVAQDISSHLGECEVYSMQLENVVLLKENYVRVGFVFPVYFQGLPIQVKKFIEQIKSAYTLDTYMFAIATCGRLKGNALNEANYILSPKTKLNYVNHMVMGDNGIALYNAKGTNQEIEQQYDVKIKKILSDIVHKELRLASKNSHIFNFYNKFKLKKTPTSDLGFQISQACVACGLCEKLCPVSNIQITSGIPRFNHNCQQCMACIQLCPSRAIDYKGKTQNRIRYLCSNISINDLIDLKRRTVSNKASIQQ